jgi:hypothetical protein
MRFIWPIKADYRIVYVSDNYEHTIVGREQRDYLWIMARTPQMAEADYAEMLAIAAREGYDLGKVRRVPQAVAGKRAAAGRGVPVKIAIVGGGIAGNVAAYHLHREHEITLFEAGNHVGGHAHTHQIEHEGRRIAVDTGFIVCNDRTYPNFLALLDELGVEVQASEMSFSVQTAGGLEYNGTTLNSLFAQRRNLVRPSFWRMIRDILRFNREAPGLLERPADPVSLGDYLQANHYSPQFVEHYILPMGAAIWSAGTATLRNFPAVYFVRFFHNHGMLSVDDRPQVAHGSRRLGAIRRGGSRLPSATASGCARQWNLCGGFPLASSSRRPGARRSGSTESSSPATATRRCASWLTRPIQNARCWVPSATSATTYCCTRTPASCRAASSPGPRGTTTTSTATRIGSPSPTT